MNKTKELIRPIPFTWWLRNRQLRLFMLRELTSFFVFGYAVFLLNVICHAGQGSEHFGHFVNEVVCGPLSIFLQLITFAFVAYHAATSFNAAPVIIDVRIGEDKLPPGLIIGVHYAMWFVASAVIFYLALQAPKG